MDYLVITSSRLESFAKVAYKDIYNVKRIPKGGIITITKSLYVYTKHGHDYHQNEVQFEEPYQDIQAVQRINTIWRTLKSFTPDDRVEYMADMDINYSSMFLWELHHAFNVPLEKMILIQKIPNYNPETRQMFLGEIWKPHAVKEFIPTKVRQMIGLSLLKIAFYNYCLKHLPGRPINLTSFLRIHLSTTLGIHGWKEPIISYITDFDITTPPMRPSFNTTGELLQKRLYQMMAEDIKGYEDPNFLDHLKEKITAFAEQRLEYTTYKNELKTIFDLGENYL